MLVVNRDDFDASVELALSTRGARTMILNIGAITVYHQLLGRNTQCLEQFGDRFRTAVRQNLVGALVTFLAGMTVDIHALSRIGLEDIGYLFQNISRFETRMLVVVDVEPDHGSLESLLQTDNRVHRRQNEGVRMVTGEVSVVGQNQTLLVGNRLGRFLRGTEMDTHFDTYCPGPYGIGIGGIG